MASGFAKQEIHLTTMIFFYSELNSVPLRCDCKLYPIVKVILNRADLKVLGKCSNRKEKLNELKGINLCGNYFGNCFRRFINITFIEKTKLQ